MPSLNFSALQNLIDWDDLVSYRDMATVRMPTVVQLAAVLLLSFGMVEFVTADSYAVSRTTFGNAMATFYGGTDGSGTYGTYTIYRQIYPFIAGSPH